MILTNIAGELERIYRTEMHIAPENYLLSTQDYIFYCEQHPDLPESTQEALLCEQDGNDVLLGLYLDPDIIHALGRDNPIQRLHTGNFNHTCLAIEGISHLLCCMWKLARGESVTLLELELQAEIDKYLLCAHWLRTQGQEARPLLTKLFTRYHLRSDVHGAAAERYQRANYWAAKFCASLETQHFSPNRMRSLRPKLREFYRRSHWQKLRHIQQM